MTSEIGDLCILEEWPAQSFKRCYPDYLYHRRAYLEGQPEMPTCSFFLTAPENSHILAGIHFHRSGNHAISQRYAPFGSFSSVSLNKDVARYFLTYILRSLRERQMHKVSIQHPSSCYHVPAIWEQLLLELGFDAKSSINHHLSVGDGSFKEKLHKMEQRKLVKSRDLSFFIQPQDRLRDIYDFIYNCRIQKQQKLSLSYEQLEQVVKLSGDHFLLCAVFCGRRMAAASIVIKVNQRCWYQFYPAHHRDFDQKSPMVFLTSELFRWGQHQGIRVIDLGTSELNGKPLEGLLTFKSHLGGISTRKTLYTKSLDN